MADFSLIAYVFYFINIFFGNQIKNYINIVKKILKDVKTRGDDAIIYYQKKFDKSSVSKKNIILQQQLY